MKATLTVGVGLIAGYGFFIGGATSSAFAQAGDPCVGARGVDDDLEIVVYTEYGSPKRGSKRATADGVMVTDRLDEFRYLKSRMRESGSATNSISVRSCGPRPQVAAVSDGKTPRFVCNPGEGGSDDVPEPFPGSIDMTLLVYDETTLAQWANTNFVPAFMSEVIADPPPSLEDAAFDIDFSLWDTAETLWIGKFRVRKSDGAIGIVSVQAFLPEDETATSSADQTLVVACNGGPFYVAKFCCATQATGCNLVRSIPFIGAALCPNCAGCVSKCTGCCVANPCHSCGPCGLTWLFNLIGIGSG